MLCEEKPDAGCAKRLFQPMMHLLSNSTGTGGGGSEIVYEALPVDDPKVRQPDITRAQQVLGWEPEVGLDEGLRKLHSSLREAPVA